ncbi:hypothetical protein QYE76_009195 [Lolium multiflorum]|uniref:MADS-box domain-containing protein n=1 Tax=Lolium multiflorum TaxID=4521 RepID=A0AAD8TRJ8_LOLMU|nr:hypothetical protein QYE76_009193 [Lolium multiflorum]KAK1692498.1 hypothetical protein QYE76_009195 [Lolium multiflorum]
MVSRIVDKRKRNKALKRRLPVLLKKAGELATLCDVPACLVAYCPGKAEPVVWPSPAAAANVVRRYRDQPNVKGFKNELGGKEFLKQKNDKVRVQISKVQMKCREEEIKRVITDSVAGHRGSFDDLPTDILVSVGCTVQNKLQAINARLQEIRSGRAALAVLPPHSPTQMVESLPMVASPLPHAPVILEPPPPQHDGTNPMTLDGEPSHGSDLLAMFDPFNSADNDSALPTTEDMLEAFLQAGMFSPLIPSPSFNP